jgi:predicted 3-demethylubiquinone-9 3-methyltransferase (glyoxalase superfamily)
MSASTLKIMNCLWFDGQAEEAARFYVSIFKNASIKQVTYVPPGQFPPGTLGKTGSVLTVHFKLEGQDFLALNGGPQFKFNEAVSLIVNCDTQAEIDSLWSKLSAQPEAEACGWLKDKYGLSWQITPRKFAEWLGGEPEQTRRYMEAMMTMKKLDIATLEKAVRGQRGP